MSGYRLTNRVGVNKQAAWQAAMYTVVQVDNVPILNVPNIV